MMVVGVPAVFVRMRACAPSTASVVNRVVRVRTVGPMAAGESVVIAVAWKPVRLDTVSACVVTGSVIWLAESIVRIARLIAWVGSNAPYLNVMPVIF